MRHLITGLNSKKTLAEKRSAKCCGQTWPGLCSINLPHFWETFYLQLPASPDRQHWRQSPHRKEKIFSAIPAGMGSCSTVGRRWLHFQVVWGPLSLFPHLPGDGC